MSLKEKIELLHRMALMIDSLPDKLLYKLEGAIDMAELTDQKKGGTPMTRLYPIIRGKMVENGLTQVDLSRRLNIGKTRLGLKLCGKDEWELAECYALMDLRSPMTKCMLFSRQVKINNAG